MAPARRGHAWREVVCDALGPLEVRIDRDALVQGEIEVGALGSIGLGRVKTTTRQSVHRTPALVRRDSPQFHRLVLAVSGRPRVAQSGRARWLAPGEFAVYDFARPYVLDYDGAVELAVFSFPVGTLALPPDSLAKLAALPISGAAGTGALAASVLRRVAVDLASYRPASAGRLATVVADLVSAALVERLDQPDVVPIESRERVLVLQIRAFVEQHLDDLDLDPAVIAAAHHVSLRHLYRLFEADGTSVAAWIRHRRLERCRADLADPALEDRLVGAVGARWGLSDPAHFSRLFRRIYGFSPTEYRQARLEVTG
ncbi:AraC-type DNA-binding protein [Nonomuraea solani]|uniref:AraC-type DNA-binding protein n=2 Tax=Nonomuraea solani TaxID=1144553 RepID=A0A1H6F2T3_9ACTN|nr:AraC-type DNA-binding protein [Nonomuraea solani]